MLGEHLSQSHDLASRRFERIDAHVDWLHRLVGGPGRVLDLACGPGLYSARLARLGHTCVGIDISPASISYAESQARRLGLECEYRLADLTEGFDDTGIDLVLLLFGDLDTIPPPRAAGVLELMLGALGPGGCAVIEAHTVDAVRRIGTAPRTWRAMSGGLFSDRSHLLLEESAWDEDARVAVRRFWVVEAGTTSLHSVTTQARDYAALLGSQGSSVEVTCHPRGVAPWVDGEFEVVVGRVA
jgi:SAM-dependent methyltransferase